MLEKICPFCGKKLTLAGEVLGSKYHDELSPRVKYSYAYRQKFEAGHIWEFPTIPMYCSECGTRIELKSNPMELLYSIILILLLIDAFFLIVIKKVIGYVLLSSLLLASLAAVVLLFRWKWIQKWRSNLKIVDKDDVSDNLIFAYMQQNNNFSGKSKKFLYATNIMWTEISGKRIYFYIVSIKKTSDKYTLCLRVCGTENEYLLLIRYLESQLPAQTIKLRFRDVDVGNAEVLETYDHPQSSTEER